MIGTKPKGPLCLIFTGSKCLPGWFVANKCIYMIGVKSDAKIIDVLWVWVIKNWKLKGQALCNAPNTMYWIPNDSVYMWSVSVPWLPPIPMTAHSKPAFSVQVNASSCTFLHLVLINSIDLYLITLFVSTEPLLAMFENRHFSLLWLYFFICTIYMAMQKCKS